VGRTADVFRYALRVKTKGKINSMFKIKTNAFTLIELMIVVAIIGILASIAIPKFADLIRKLQEATTKGNLGVLRSALSIYYVDNEGFYPYGRVC
jgi:prepilin-type N-terminal cleavage/methylation domain-containing protein